MSGTMVPLIFFTNRVKSFYIEKNLIPSGKRY
jgi:hypothetical protein